MLPPNNAKPGIAGMWCNQYESGYWQLFGITGDGAVEIIGEAWRNSGWRILRRTVTASDGIRDEVCDAEGEEDGPAGVARATDALRERGWAIRETASVESCVRWKLAHSLMTGTIDGCKVEVDPIRVVATLIRGKAPISAAFNLLAGCHGIDRTIEAAERALVRALSEVTDG